MKYLEGERCSVYAVPLQQDTEKEDKSDFLPMRLRIVRLTPAGVYAEAELWLVEKLLDWC